MFVPVLLFAFSGIIVGLSTLFKNKTLMVLADPDGLWYQCWYVIEQGGWTVFNQMPLLFAIGIPVALAKKRRRCLEALTVYLTFNYFINAILTVWGGAFHVDMTQEAGGTSGLTMIAGIKTLDTNIIGAIFISSIVVYLHNRYFDKNCRISWGFFRIFLHRYHFFLHYDTDFTCGGIRGDGSVRNRLAAKLSRFFRGDRRVDLHVPGADFNSDLCIILFTRRLFTVRLWLKAVSSPIGTASRGILSKRQTAERIVPAGFALHGNSKIFGIPGIALAFTPRLQRKRKSSPPIDPGHLDVHCRGNYRAD